MSELEVIVIGAGSAGLGVGYHLRQADLEFVILEQGSVGESWRSQRWESFTVNTPNRISGLPGTPFEGDDPEGFLHRDELVALFERHADDHGLPIRTGITVTQVARDGDGFVVETRDRARASETMTARCVVVAAGGQRVPRIPAIAERLPGRITQMHAADYRAPGRLPDGPVVVVGSGQSGCQIAEDLLEAGRDVYLFTSRVARVPRRYRGRDVLDWMDEVGLLDETVTDLDDPAMQYAAQPQVSGLGARGHTVSLQDLQRRGVRLLGRLADVVGDVLVSDDSLAAHIAFADGFSAQMKAGVDAYVEAQGIDAPPPEDDPADAPAGSEVAQAGLISVDLVEANVGTVIWCTGFTGDYEFLNVPVLDDRGQPVHDRGVASVPGLYFLGMPWLHSRKSGILLGIDEDARWVVNAITERITD